MVFSSILFLCIFLPAVLIVYYAVPQKLRNFWLLLSSLVFYAWDTPRYALIMLFTIGVDYASGLWIARLEAAGKRRAKKAVLIVTLVLNLGTLGLFKYTDFLIGTVNSALGAGIPLLHWALPIGISFYTFQTLSYTVDVYRGRVKAQKNLVDFAMYVTLFPQLIAGPIVRYSDVEADLTERRPDAEKFSRGVIRFSVGLGKKVLLANQISSLWTTLSEANPTGQVPVLTAWLGAAAIGLQYYFDFSGYSDMAIGMGQMFGFRFPENFRYPYEAESISDYWRRWHITLSAWFREYVYYPLGGNRCGKYRQIFNMLVVWALTGLWHGANWNYVLWGLFFWTLLVAEKLFLGKWLEKIPRVFRHLYTGIAVCVGWFLFGVENLGSMAAWIGSMFGYGGALWSDESLYALVTRLPLLVVMAVGSTSLPSRLMQKLKATRLGEQGTFAVEACAAFLCLLLSIAFLNGDSNNPFLYFRF